MSIERKLDPQIDPSLQGLKPVRENDDQASIVPLDDREVIIRRVIIDNPAKGCELLFRRYYAPLCSHAVRFVSSRQIAEDIVGDVFFSLWEKKLFKDIHSSYRAYLFAAVRNRCLKHLQKEFKISRNDITAVEDDHQLVATPEQVIQYHELSLRIEQSIKSLSPQCQKVFLMSRFEGKKNHDIARELAVSVKAIEAHMTKALSVLRKALLEDT